MRSCACAERKKADCVCVRVCVRIEKKSTCQEESGDIQNVSKESKLKDLKSIKLGIYF